MPIFDFRCPKCGAEVKNKRISSAVKRPVVKCPECKNRRMRMVIGGAGLHFKIRGQDERDARQW